MSDDTHSPSTDNRDMISFPSDLTARDLSFSPFSFLFSFSLSFLLILSEYIYLCSPAIDARTQNVHATLYHTRVKEVAHHIVDSRRRKDEERELT